uniref:Uncharacterized protein n=1 Tax=Salix viminalis TaxID=40686 RepID=A0A6N2KCK2_SALVM
MAHKAKKITKAKGNPKKNHINTCPCQRTHPSDSRRIYDPKNHRFAEFASDVGLSGTRRQTVQDTCGYWHHDDSRCHVVHPHADKCRGGTNSKEEQWGVQWISTEQHSYLHGPQLCKNETIDLKQVRKFLVYRKNLFAFVKEQQWLIQCISTKIITEDLLCCKQYRSNSSSLVRLHARS